MMKIIGCDLSMNSSGLFKQTLDDNLEPIDFEILGFTSVKKISEISQSIKFYKKEWFFNNIDRFSYFAKEISEFTKDCKFASIEGPSYGSKGILFEIGEFTGMVKKSIYDNGTKIRIIDPNSIKMFATDKGTANKGSMAEFFYKSSPKEVQNLVKDLPQLEEKDARKGKSPISDLIDSYFISELLRLELKLRKASINLKDLPEKTISIFNRVTKKYPTNLLDSPFISNELGE